MIRTVAGLLMTALLSILIGCSSQENKKQDQGHVDEEAIQITAWSEKSELFMEYAPLQPGKNGSFLIHLTRIADGKPVTEGALRLLLRPASGEPLTLAIPAPSRPGIYQAELTAPAAGTYQMELLPEGKGFADRIVVPGVYVGPTPKADPAKTVKDVHTKALGAALVIGDGGGTISFLKEQQWSLDVLLRRPEQKQLSGQLSASGELVAAADGEATVAAPLSGVLSVVKPVPYLGKRVAKGELIALIEPPVRPDGGAGQLASAHAEAKKQVDPGPSGA